MSDKPTISVIYSLARSGGTLLSRCLGCIDGNVLLSEVNPTRSVISPKQQALQWHGIDVPDGDYVDVIKAIHKKVEEQGKKLIIRDWSHIDFIGYPFVEPSYKLRQKEVLEPYFNIKSIALTRNLRDTYASTAGLSIMQGSLDKYEYTRGWFSFMYEIMLNSSINSTSYREFTHNPMGVIEDVCGVLGINYSPDFYQNFSTYDKVTGDKGRGSEIIPSAE